jgi:hypothetical protein
MRLHKQCRFLSAPVSMMTHPQKMNRRWKQYWPAKWSLFVRQLFEINKPTHLVHWEYKRDSGRRHGFIYYLIHLSWEQYLPSEYNIDFSLHTFFNFFVFSPSVFSSNKRRLLSDGVYIRILFYHFSATKRMKGESAWLQSILGFAGLWRRVI